MRILTAVTYYFCAVGAGVSLINLNVDYSMRFGGIALISFLSFTLINTEKK